MPFKIVRNDIANMQVDAIINTANPHAIIGDGVDSSIHDKAGPELLKAREAIGDIAVGQAAVTPGFGLDAKYVIHTVGPVWRGGEAQEEALLHNCYEHGLGLAAAYGCESVAFPLISSGHYGFPKELALQVAVAEISRFLQDHEMMVYLVVFDRTAYVLSEQRFKAVESYIDETYVDIREANAYRADANGDLRSRLRRRFRRTESPEEQEVLDIPAESTAAKAMEPSRGVPAKKAVESETARRDIGTEEAESREAARGVQKPTATRKLEDLLAELDDTFSEALLRMIDSQQKKDSEVYKKANIDRKLFSKIRSNREYRPSKATALALAIALELNLDEVQDLIGRAGYTLTHSSKFDIIIEYFIVQGSYNIYEINEVLFAFDQPLIGG